MCHWQAVQLAMDRKDRERELVSYLLVALTPDTISPDQVGSNLSACLLDFILVTLLALCCCGCLAAGGPCARGHLLGPRQREPGKVVPAAVCLAVTGCCKGLESDGLL